MHRERICFEIMNFNDVRTLMIMGRTILVNRPVGGQASGLSCVPTGRFRDVPEMIDHLS
jgi:hypothetical protein